MSVKTVSFYECNVCGLEVDRQTTTDGILPNGWVEVYQCKHVCDTCCLIISEAKCVRTLSPDSGTKVGGVVSSPYQSVNPHDRAGVTRISRGD